MTSHPDRRLCIAPRAATLTIAADPALEADYRASWQGAAPTVRERGAAIEIGYTIGGRLRAFSIRRGSLTLALNPAAGWAIELRGGVAGVRADLRELRLSELVVSGGASDLVLDLPDAGAAPSLRVEGGLSRAVVRRPPSVPLSVQIDGGARDLRLDDIELGSIGRVVRQRTPGEDGSGEEVALRVLGGASGLTVAAYER